MKRAVAASGFVANMAMKHNAIQYEHMYRLAAKVVKESIYIDDGLTGADMIELTIQIRQELLELFEKGCSLLRKWNSSSPEVLDSVPIELRDIKEVLCISGPSYAFRLRIFLTHVIHAL